jgi:hypothetical protein
MTKGSKTALIVGFILLAVIAVFPPRRSDRHGVVSRKFLFSGRFDEYVLRDYSDRDKKEGITSRPSTELFSGAQIDVGKIIAESLLAASVTGLCVVALNRR